MTEQRAADAEIAIDIRNVSKRFKLYHNMVLGPLKDILFFWRKGSYYRAFCAVDDASFQVRRGEVVGIIGPNGAGKTTLLKMIAGLLPVDSGSITVRGRINALLALGVGIHPEFTGRENIYYGGLMLGMKAAEIEAKMDAIIEFAELGDFIDRPFRTYSSGMRSRLLFSISMSIEPDILIVDEALATGDAYFVQKCGKRIRDLCNRGATILFVSHNLAQIRDLCQRAVLIAGGRVLDDGTPDDVIASYNEYAFSREAERVKEVAAQTGLKLLSGDAKVIVRDIRWLDSERRPTSAFHTADTAILEVEYENDLPPGTECNFFVGLDRMADRQWVGEISTRFYVEPDGREVQRTRLRLDRKGVVRVTLEPLLLLNHQYSVWIMVQTGPVHCEYRWVAPIFVGRKDHVFDRAPVFWQPCRFELVAARDEQLPARRLAQER